MTTVNFVMDDRRIKITALDHAYGSEIVCNGVSILMYSLEAWLRNHPSTVKYHESKFKSGNAVIEIIPVDPIVFTMLGFVYNSLLNVEYSYGDKYIKVNASDELKWLMG